MRIIVRNDQCSQAGSGIEESEAQTKGRYSVSMFPRRVKHEVLARVVERQINLLKECQRCGACFDSSQEFCVHDRSELTLSLPVERLKEDIDSISSWARAAWVLFIR